MEGRMITHDDVVNKENDTTKSFGKADAYKMRPTLAETFQASQIKQIIQNIMISKLNGKTYTAVDASKWTREIADAVNASVKNLEQPRYKHVVQVTLGQQLGAGCRYIAKCCWDAESDSQTSDVFSNILISGIQDGLFPYTISMNETTVAA